MLFKYEIELQYEIDGPLQKVWELHQETETWLKCNETLESCFYEGELKEGTIIKTKIKNKNIHVNILVTELVPYSKYTTFIKIPFFSQELCVIFKAKTENTTSITCTAVIRGPIPFLKRYSTRKLQDYYLKFSKIFKQLHEKKS